MAVWNLTEKAGSTQARFAAVCRQPFNDFHFYRYGETGKGSGTGPFPVAFMAMRGCGKENPRAGPARMAVGSP